MQFYFWWTTLHKNSDRKKKAEKLRKSKKREKNKKFFTQKIPNREIPVGRLQLKTCPRSLDRNTGKEVLSSIQIQHWMLQKEHQIPLSPWPELPNV